MRSTITKTRTLLGAGAAILFASTSAVFAGGVAPATETVAPVAFDPGPTRSTYGELRFGVGVIVPHATLLDAPPFPNNGPCSNDDVSEFCDHTFSASGYGGVYVPLNDTWSLIGDLTLDYHGSTDSDGGPDEPLVYTALGLHAVYEGGAQPWGVFVLYGHGQGHEEDDDMPDFAGIGFETMFNDYWVQVGGVHSLQSDGVDGLGNLFFVRGGRDMALGNGTLRLGVALGVGDFDDDPGGGFNKDDSHWAQLTARYYAPLNESMEWYAGYQGDLVAIDEPSENFERSFVSGFELGLRMTFGGDGSTSNRLPFETPNLRAPISYSGEMN